MKALVTGGTGFVGSHVVRALVEAGHEVRVLHRSSSRLDGLTGLAYESALGDVTDLDALRSASQGVDWVFHVAAVADYWRANADWMRAVNVDGTRYVLQAAQEAGVRRVVFTSSAAAIGLPSDDTPADENTPFNLSPAQFPYGYTKVQAEAVVQEYVAQGLDVVIVNPVVVLGPGDLNQISGDFVIKVAQMQWTVPATRGGIAVIDVRDVAHMHIRAAEVGRTGERYILATENMTYQAWFSLIAEVVGVAKPLVTLPSFVLSPLASLVDGARRVGIGVPIDANQVRLGGRYVYFDGRKAHEAFGAPRYSMRQSVEDTYAWYVENGYIQPTRTSRLLKTIKSG